MALPLLLLVYLAAIVSAASFENSAIVRTFELGGSLVQATTTYAIKALEPGAKTYTISLSAEDRQKTSWLEVKIKGRNDKLPIEESKLDHSLCVANDIYIPRSSCNLPLGHTISLMSSFPRRLS